MISKRLFRNGIQFDLQRRSWLFLLLLIVNFLITPVLYLIRLQNVTQNPGNMMENGVMLSREQVIVRQQMTATREFFSAQNGFLTMLLILTAMVAAYTGYAWLCSRRKVDFFHSIPARRERIFWTVYLDGVLVGLLPFLVSILIGYFGIGSAHHMVTGEMTRAVSGAIAENMVVFLATYSVCVIAMTLSGRVLIGILLSVMMLVYGPLAHFLYTALMELSFDTWPGSTRAGTGMYLSPASLALLFFRRADGRSDESMVFVVAMLVVFAAGGALAAYLIYRKRPSETAGNAYLHPVLKAVFKVMVAIPSAMVIGIVFQNMAYIRVWFAAGALIGVLGACAVMEAVQNVDLRSIYRNWRSTVAALAGTAVLLFIFLLDPLGYDSYLPEAEKLSAIGFLDGSGAIAEQSGYFGLYHFGGSISSQMQYVMTEDVSVVYPLAEAGVMEAAGNENDGFPDNSTAENTAPETGEDLIVDDRISDEDAAAKGAYTEIQLVYALRNGIKRYRTYRVPVASVRKAMDTLTSDQAFRERAYPINRTDADFFNVIMLSDWLRVSAQDNNREIALSEQECRTLIEAMKQDFNGQSTGELRRAEPIGVLSMKYVDAMHTYLTPGQGVPDTYFIYPMYEQTIAFLKEKGYSFGENQTMQKVMEGALKAHIYYNEKEYTLTEQADLQKLAGCVSRARYDMDTASFPAATIVLDYQNKTDYNVDCIVKDKAAMEALLADKEVYY